MSSNSLRATTKRPTLGVIGNRQIYSGATIARYEQILLRGIRAAARAYGCNLLLACGVGADTPNFQRRPAWPLALPHTDFVPVGPWNTDGLLAIPPFTEEQQRSLELLPPGYPVVLTSSDERYLSLGPDNAAGIAQALGHLVAHGHRRIVFLSADTQSDGVERLAAYHAAMRAHGLPSDGRLVIVGGHRRQVSQRALAELLDAGVEFTAVLASNDESAIGALWALIDAGRRVPGDVALIGFDDVLYAKAQAPPLTTVRHPTFEIGYRAVELLLDYLNGRRTESTSVRVPTRLVVRESCGCQPYGAPIDTDRAALADAPALDSAGLAEAVAEAVAAEVRQSNLALIGEWCAELVAAFLASLNRADPQPFTAAVDQLLQRVAAAKEDAYPLQAAISVLRERLPALLVERAPPASLQAAEDLLDQARVRISERIRRQHTRFLMQEAEQLERIGAMTSQLLTALDPRQILDILADHLPRIAIRHAHIALFEAQDDDPAAWSSVYVRVEGAPPEVRRFRSHQFPPPGLYDPATPFHLALLPLLIEDGPAGFVAFEAGYLEPCGLIVRHLAAAFRHSQLYAAAEQGRRMAEEANRLKSRFLSIVSHELRTPLNLIAGLSEILLREQTSQLGSARRDIERIYLNAQHLGHLIGDVLDLASSEAGQLRLQLEPLDLAETLRPVALIGAQMAEQKGLSWRDYLTASFRQEMDITPIAYLNRYRISRARVLLETGSQSVAEIAQSVGFGDAAHFSRAFRREVGQAPNSYRREKQG